MTLLSRSIAEREADALANMLGADSRRIDDLVDDVGEIKGDMRSLKSDSARTASGVEQLQQSMVVLSRHAVLMETQSAEISGLREKNDKLDVRLRAVETEMPALKETRVLTMRAVTGIVALVGLAVIGLVVMK